MFQAELPVLQRSRARVLGEALPQSQVAKLVSKVSHINNERNIFKKVGKLFYEALSSTADNWTNPSLDTI